MGVSPAVKGLVFIGLMAALFFFGSGWTVYRQQTGTPVQARVSSCTGGRRSLVCRGTWMLDGRFHMGTIDGATRSDLGQRIEVRSWGDRAVKPGLRLPLILFGIGLAVAVLGALWWVREAPRPR